jgi:hypothetical protein
MGFIVAADLFGARTEVILVVLDALGWAGWIHAVPAGRRSAAAGSPGWRRVGVVHQVAGGEHVWDVGVGARRAGKYVAILVGAQRPAHQLAARVVADRHEHRGDAQH